MAIILLQTLKLPFRDWVTLQLRQNLIVPFENIINIVFKFTVESFELRWKHTGWCECIVNKIAATLIVIFGEIVIVILVLYTALFLAILTLIVLLFTIATLTILLWGIYIIFPRLFLGFLILKIFVFTFWLLKAPYAFIKHFFTFFKNFLMLQKHKKCLLSLIRC